MKGLVFRSTVLFSLLAMSLYSLPIYSQKSHSRVIYHIQQPQTATKTEVKKNITNAISIENDSSMVRNDTLYIQFDLVLKGNVVNGSNSLHITPVYFSDGGEVRFSEILINGRSRSSYYNRERALATHDEYWEGKPYALLNQLKGKEQRVSYRHSEPLPKALLTGGRLTLEQLVEDCCELKPLSSLDLTLDKPAVVANNNSVATPCVTQPVYESSVTFIRPVEEKVKERNEQLTVRINYIVGRHDILPRYANNENELYKVERALRPLTSRHETYKIRSASIRGYASPESPYEFNLALSQRRADTFKSYLINEYGLYNISKFTVQGMGEDWDGLRRAVKDSYMDYKNEVLSIIDGVGLFNGREKMLMDLAGGEPYRYMLRVLYPPLRRMEMSISYVVRSFERAEVEEVIKDRPQDLSQEEIFDLARVRNRSDIKGLNREEYGKEYDIAARYFPDDATANINASSAALVRGDMNTALAYLQKVWTNPKAYNNIGVYYLLTGDKDKAKEFFTKALSIDKERAEYNLNLIKTLK